MVRYTGYMSHSFSVGAIRRRPTYIFLLFELGK
jgi:hypothetical protein